MSFTAKFSGTECANCGDDILKGQEIEYNWDRELMHVFCPESLSQGQPRPVCPSCFMELPVTGRCEECFPDD